VIFVIVGIVLAILVVTVGGFLLSPTRRRQRAVGSGDSPGVTESSTDDATALPQAVEPSPALEAPTEGDAPPQAEPDSQPLSEPLSEPLAETATEVPPPSQGRLVRLRSRLSGSQSGLGRGLLALLSRDSIDDDVWDELEDTLLVADVGVGASGEIVAHLREQVRVLGTRDPAAVRDMVRAELLESLRPDDDRSLHALPHDGMPAVVLVVGVNGTGKTTTCGKLARVLVGDGHTVLLGAADTFRAAAADQLATWGERVGASVVRGPEGSDPASVAFDAVHDGTERGVDTVVIDTAGRLHTKAGLMDELTKVKRVVERQRPIDEVLLVLDSTTGQNGLVQARMFSEAVSITGVVLTKLDGTARGGIVFAVQRELGVPVKFVGLGEGADDLAPFDPEVFVDAILGA
jgi:fused signal recognition particle receptor